MIFMVAAGWLAALSSFWGPSQPSPSVSRMVGSTQAVPSRALRFQRSFTANTRLVWGLNGPLATMAAQVHQESSWNPDARSPYANGLAQFTPATATWISQTYPDLAGNQPYEPEWAFRALARYDKLLYDHQQSATTECDRWAFTLSGYNGGEGNVTKDQRLAASKGRDSHRWFDQVELASTRSASAFTENRAYPKRILLVLQPIYQSWGPMVHC